MNSKTDLREGREDVVAAGARACAFVRACAVVRVATGTPFFFMSCFGRMMWPSATSVCGLKVLVYEGLRY
jgi:hypothetical protein